MNQENNQTGPLLSTNMRIPKPPSPPKPPTVKPPKPQREHEKKFDPKWQGKKTFAQRINGRLLFEFLAEELTIAIYDKLEEIEDNLTDEVEDEVETDDWTKLHKKKLDIDEPEEEPEQEEKEPVDYRKKISPAAKKVGEMKNASTKRRR